MFEVLIVLRVLMVSEMPRVIRRLITKGKTHRCADAQVRKVRINVGQGV